MKVVSYTKEYESRQDKQLTIVPLGDIHRGSRGMDEELFYKTIDHIVKHNLPVIGMGDYGEFISKNDRRHDYAGISFKYLTPDQQYRRIRDDFMDIKDNIICILSGNHEYSYWRYNDIDWGNWLAAELGVPYCPDFAYIKVKFKRKTGENSKEIKVMRILAHHGWTNARTDGYKIKVIHNMKEVFPDCHVYLMGHVHRLGEALPTSHLWVDNGDNIREFTQRYFFTGSFVKNYEAGDSHDEGALPFSNYAARRGYAPTMLGAPLIHVKPNRVDGTRRDDKTPFNIKYETLDWHL